VPSPTAWPIFRWSASLFAIIPFQLLEASLRTDLGSTSTSLQYFLLRTCAQRPFEFVRSLHPSFIMRAELSWRIDRKPSPPFSLGFVISSQATKWVLRSPAVPPQKNLLVFLSSSSQILLGTQVDCMTCVGIADIVELIKVALPAMERHFVFHPTSRLSPYATFRGRSPL